MRASILVGAMDRMAGNIRAAADCVWIWTEEIADGIVRMSVGVCDEDGEPIDDRLVVTVDNIGVAYQEANAVMQAYPGLIHEVVEDVFPEYRGG